MSLPPKAAASPLAILQLALPFALLLPSPIFLFAKLSYSLAKFSSLKVSFSSTTRYKAFPPTGKTYCCNGVSAENLCTQHGRASYANDKSTLQTQALLPKGKLFSNTTT